MMTQLRTPVLVVSVAALLAFCAYAVNWLVPFNLTYTKRVKASYLRNEVKEWKMLGEPKSYGHTNETVVSYVWRTNLNVGSGSVSTVMRLDSALFRDRGYLVATSSREVFWVGRNGRGEALSAE